MLKSLRNYCIAMTMLVASMHATLASVSISDISEFKQGTVAAIVKPETVEELRSVVATAQGPLSVAGGRASQGGHIWAQGGTVIDMTRLNRIIDFNVRNKTITVEAGMKWRTLEEFLVPQGLMVAIMQSYNDFSVGGSLSVNAHGRMTHGQLINSVVALKVLLADGSLVVASRTENTELFQAAIGGYGACGVIVEATLQLVENDRIERVVRKMSGADYQDFFKTHIYKNPLVVLHNADIYPPACDDVISITWYKTNSPCTIHDKLQPTSADLGVAVGRKVVERLPGGISMRAWYEENFAYDQERVCWRSYEMSHTIASLELFRTRLYTNILQEYFIPMHSFERFMVCARAVFKKYNVNALNVSIRYVPASTESVLSYAPQDSFSFVLYVNLPASEEGYEEAQVWSRVLIDYALSCGGTYYLPYQLFASQQQFERAYPRHKEFKNLRKKYDPTGRFGNTFLNTYLA